MPFDYEAAKKFFNDKLTNDLEGKGRVESALFHTATMIYGEGCKDNDAVKDARIAELERKLERLANPTEQMKREGYLAMHHSRLHDKDVFLAAMESYHAIRLVALNIND